MFFSNGFFKIVRESIDWWVNDYRYLEKGVYGWLNVGYEVVVINLDKEYVVFNKLVKFSWLFD